MHIQLELEHWHILTTFIAVYGLIAILTARLFFRNRHEKSDETDEAVVSFWLGVLWPVVVAIVLFYWCLCLPIYYLVTFGNNPQVKEQPKKE